MMLRQISHGKPELTFARVDTKQQIRSQQMFNSLSNWLFKLRGKKYTLLAPWQGNNTFVRSWALAPASFVIKARRQRN